MAAYQVLETTCRLIDRGGLDRRTKLEATGRITHEMKKDPMLLEVFAVERIQNCARGLMSDTDTSVRTAALRVLRYSMINSASTAQAIKLGVHLFVSRSMERDAKLVGERIQALKVVRRFMDIDALQVPTSVVRSIVAIANHKEDNLRRVALETLRELAIANVSVVMQCNGMKTLVDCILDPTCQDIAEALLMTLIYLINEPANRNLIHSFVNVQVLLAPFTDTDSPAGTERRQRWTASRNAIVMMMRSWTGILVLTANPQGLRALVRMLEQPVGDDVKKVVLATICDIFYTNAPLDKNGNDIDRSQMDPTKAGLAMSDKPIVSTHGGTNLLDNYMVLVLLSLGHCGLLEALVALGTCANRSALAEPAIELLSEVLHLSARLLPDQHCAMLLALPQLVATTAYSKVDYLADLQSKPPEDRGEREHAIRASEMLAELARAVGASSSSGGLVTRQNPSTVNGVHLASELLRGTNRPLHNFNVHSQRDSAREMLVYDLKVHLDNQMDDHTFRDLLMHKSRVLYGKDWFRWNWDIISELLEGPLTNPARLSEAMKTKFFKRVSGFFRCDNSDKGFFAGLPWTPDYVPYLRPACQMYTLLLNHPEGIAFLKTDRRGQLLNEISTALELEGRPEATIVESHLGELQSRMFSPEYCSRRMLREYFTLLGLMSSSPEGLKMMQRIFARLTKLGTVKDKGSFASLDLSKSQRAVKDKSQSHDFLCRLILANLDYTVEGSSRQLLTDWMNYGSESLRLYATCLLRALLRSEIEGFERWGIESLVAQLDKEPNVARAALSVLEEAAEQSPVYLSAMIKKRSLQFVHLQAESLLLKFLSLPEGLAFLKDVPNWISSNLMQWRQVKYVQYVHLVESQLLCGVFRDKQSVTTNASKAALKPVPIPVTVPNRRSSNFKHGPHREQWGLEWLFRMPWNIEVKLVGPPGSGPPAHLTIDAFVDASETGQDVPSSSDGNPLSTIRIKGVVVDARNIPKPVMVNSQQTLQACLFLGAQPVDRKGHTRPAPTTNGGFPAPNDKEPGSAVAAASATAPPIRSRTESRGVTDRLSEFSMDSSTAYEAPEENKDWSSCGPEHRTAAVLFNAAINTNASGSEKEARLCPAGERAVWTFDMDTDNQQIKRVQLKSVEFTIQLLPTKAPTVPLPRHFYGELAKTEDGCAILRQSGHLSELVASLKDPTVVPLEKRAALWTLGHIAGTNRGFELLLSYADDLVECIVHMATSCQLLSLRGTSIFALGLISRSSAGRRALSQAGWIAPRGSNVSIAVPNNVASLFEWPSVSHTPFPSELVDLSTSFVSPNFIKSGKASAKAKEILRLIGDLSSTISQKEAGASLNRMKGAHPELFEDTETALAAHTILARYHYRLSARQFVMNLFEKADLSNASLNQYLYQGEESAQVVPQGGRRRRSSVNAPSLSSTIQSLLHSHSKETVLATARHIPDHENTIFVGASEALV
ncbi:hypothetical protein, variant 1 [Aphanomyces invadans]|uniref:Rapamycin-insensitive companion of mTOR domain-containing protein n=1 Tax=Aphanomyces invadans TaxID=157072 RepID=A0A024TTR0_9STRA|nr:hypothetical protein, variant 1 [Aphanomyces invadans]ETV97011.1 hypothetical protein, variant 1 [Aphanomyces invadans]|eukprot:XP_008874258.1 hypothetical protein, variant 1 [Aphanomyces invadans]